VRRQRPPDSLGQFRTEVEVGKPAAQLSLARVRMTAPQSGPAKGACRGTHLVRQSQASPCGSPPPRLDQHLFGLRSRIRRLRLHHGRFMTRHRPPVPSVTG
jgi:hypothetical protein